LIARRKYRRLLDQVRDVARSSFADLIGALPEQVRSRPGRNGRAGTVNDQTSPPLREGLGWASRTLRLTNAHPDPSRKREGILEG